MAEKLRLSELVTREVPLLGSIDRALLASNSAGILELNVHGWIAHPGLVPVLLEARLDETPPVTASRVVRPDIEEMFSDALPENIFGFELHLPVPSISKSPNRFTIRCLISDRDGRSVPCSFPVLPIRYHAPGETKQTAAKTLVNTLDLETTLYSHLGVKISAPCVDKPIWSAIIFGTTKSYPTLRELVLQLPKESEILFAYRPAQGDDYSFLGNITGLRPVPLPRQTSWATMWNRLVAQSRGQYILCVDGETILYPGAINALAKKLLAEERHAVVTGKLVTNSGELLAAGGSICAPLDFEWRGFGERTDDSRLNFACEVDFCSSAFLALRRESWEEIGGAEELYDGRRFVEADLQIRLSRAGWKIWYTPTAVATLPAMGGSIHEGVLEGAHDRVIFERTHKLFLESRARDQGQRRPTDGSRLALRRALLVAGPTQSDAEDRSLLNLTEGLVDLGVQVAVLVYGELAISPTGLERALPETVEIISLPDTLTSWSAEFTALIDQRLSSFDLVWCFGLLQLRLLERTLKGRRGARPTVVVSQSSRPVLAGTSMESLELVDLSSLASTELTLTDDALIIQGSGKLLQLRQACSLLNVANYLLVSSAAEEQIWRRLGAGSVYCLGELGKEQLSKEQGIPRQLLTELVFGRASGVSVFPASTLSASVFGNHSEAGELVAAEIGFGGVGRLNVPKFSQFESWGSVGQNKLEELPTKQFSRTSRVSFFTDQLTQLLEIDIIVPVFNALDFTKRCLSSVVRNSDVPFRLIIVDDASTDSAVEPWLRSLPQILTGKMLRGITVIRNLTNVGFPESVNRGLAISKGHVIILNSDTEVPPGWLGRMLAPVVKDARIGSVTPFSNAATICCFPQLDYSYDLPEGASVDEIDKLVFQFAPEQPITIPTGVGFCMLLSRLALDTVGWFDSLAFGRGYGEENDWCARLIEAGFRNVLAPNLFVYHAGEASFSESKSRIKTQSRNQILGQQESQLDSRGLSILRNLETVEVLHPGYRHRIGLAIESDPMKAARRKIVEDSTAESQDKVGVLYLHPEGIIGGSANYLEKLLTDRSSDERQYRLSWNSERFLFTNLCNGLPWQVPSSASKLNPELLTPESLRELATAAGVKKIVVNHLIGSHLNRLVKAIRWSGIPYTAVLHDYYTVCPSYNLLNAEAKYCGAETQEAVCDRCLRLGLRIQDYVGERANEPFIGKWRNLFREFLSGATQIIAPSASAAKIFRKYYPELTIDVCSHQPHVDLEVSYQTEFAEGRELRVAILGAINHGKGELIIEQLVDEIQRRALPIKVTVVGKISKSEKPFVSADGVLAVTGGYNPDQVSELLAETRAAVVLMPAIWPETFSYTTQEALNSGFPVVCFDLGGTAEQVRTRQGGWIVSECTTQALLAELLRLNSNRAEIAAVAGQIRRQDGECAPSPERKDSLAPQLTEIPRG